MSTSAGSPWGVPPTSWQRICYISDVMDSRLKRYHEVTETLLLRPLPSLLTGSAGTGGGATERPSSPVSSPSSDPPSPVAVPAAESSRAAVVPRVSSSMSSAVTTGGFSTTVQPPPPSPPQRTAHSPSPQVVPQAGSPLPESIAERDAKLLLQLRSFHQDMDELVQMLRSVAPCTSAGSSTLTAHSPGGPRHHPHHSAAEGGEIPSQSDRSSISMNTSESLSTSNPRLPAAAGTTSQEQQLHGAKKLSFTATGSMSLSANSGRLGPAPPPGPMVVAGSPHVPRAPHPPQPLAPGTHSSPQRNHHPAVGPPSLHDIADALLVQSQQQQQQQQQSSYSLSQYYGSPTTTGDVLTYLPPSSATSSSGVSSTAVPPPPPPQTSTSVNPALFALFAQELQNNLADVGASWEQSMSINPQAVQRLIAMRNQQLQQQQQLVGFPSFTASQSASPPYHNLSPFVANRTNVPSSATQYAAPTPLPPTASGNNHNDASRSSRRPSDGMFSSDNSGNWVPQPLVEEPSSAGLPPSMHNTNNNAGVPMSPFQPHRQPSLRRQPNNNNAMSFSSHASHYNSLQPYITHSAANPVASQSGSSLAWGRFGSVSSMSVASMIGGVMPTHTHVAARTQDLDTGIKLLNNYVLMETIGSGASGKVKLGFSLERNLSVAIKIVRRKNMTKGGQGGGVDPLARSGVGGHEAAFQREIAVMKKLRHKNIVSLYEVIDDPEAAKLYLVMQYVDRGAIGKVHADGSCATIPPARLARIGRQVAAGLEYLHNHGVIHRDIKPENILMDSDDRVFLSDFGVSETIAGVGPTKILGTPFFMPISNSVQTNHTNSGDSKSGSMSGNNSTNPSNSLQSGPCPPAAGAALSSLPHHHTAAPQQPCLQVPPVRSPPEEHDWNQMSGMERSVPASLANVNSPELLSPDGRSTSSPTAAAPSGASAGGVLGQQPHSPLVTRSKPMVQLPPLPGEESDGNSAGAVNSNASVTPTTASHTTTTTTTTGTSPSITASVTPPPAVGTSAGLNVNINRKSAPRTAFADKTKDDTWALGVTLYVLLVGTSPYEPNVEHGTEMQKRVLSSQFSYQLLSTDKLHEHISCAVTGGSINKMLQTPTSPSAAGFYPVRAQGSGSNRDVASVTSGAESQRHLLSSPGQLPNASVTAVFDLNRASTTTLPPSAANAASRHYHHTTASGPPLLSDGTVSDDSNAATTTMSQTAAGTLSRDGVLSPSMGTQRQLADSMPSKTFTDLPRSSSNGSGKHEEAVVGAAAEADRDKHSNASCSPLVAGLRTLSPQIAEVDEQLVEAWIQLFDSMLTLDARKRLSARAARQSLKAISALYTQREDLISAQFQGVENAGDEEREGEFFTLQGGRSLAESMQGANQSLFGYSAAVAPTMEVSPFELDHALTPLVALSDIAQSHQNSQQTNTTTTTTTTTQGSSFSALNMHARLAAASNNTSQATLGVEVTSYRSEVGGSTAVDVPPLSQFNAATDPHARSPLYQPDEDDGGRPLPAAAAGSSHEPSTASTSGHYRYVLGGRPSSGSDRPTTYAVTAAGGAGAGSVVGSRTSSVSGVAPLPQAGGSTHGGGGGGSRSASRSSSHSKLLVPQQTGLHRHLITEEASSSPTAPQQQQYHRQGSGGDSSSLIATTVLSDTQHPFPNAAPPPVPPPLSPPSVLSTFAHRSSSHTMMMTMNTPPHHHRGKNSSGGSSSGDGCKPEPSAPTSSREAVSPYAGVTIRRSFKLGSA